MLEKIKEVPFIEESKAVKVGVQNGKLYLERNTRVIWASEVIDLDVEGLNCYVEADKFFNLLPEIKYLKQTTCLEVQLKNGARYTLPFLTVEWETLQMLSGEETETINFKLDDLMLCTLKNLVKPELQCVYIDSEGAISCDFISACITDIVKSTQPILLPPDVQELTSGRICQVTVTEDTLYFASSNFNIITARPSLSEEAKQDFVGLREMSNGATGFTAVDKLQEGLRRLVLFGDFISFEADRAVVGENFEPFNFRELAGLKYEIECLRKVILTASEITELQGNLILKNTSSRFLVSAVQEDE